MKPYYETAQCKLYQGDCLDIVHQLAEASCDMIFADLPYGSTDEKWDVPIPFEPMWECLKHVSKANAAIIFTAREPFTSLLICSNLKGYKHKWVWNKKQSGSWQNAKYMPLQIEEDVVVFEKIGGKVNYFPQMITGRQRKRGNATKKGAVSKSLNTGYSIYSDQYYPVNIIEIPNCIDRKNNAHPTQKPVALMDYLIRNYTKKDQTVLDFTMGSGSTGVAAINAGRCFVGIEKNKLYCEIADRRIKNETAQMKLFAAA